MTMGRVAVEKNLEAFLSLEPAGIESGDRRRAAEGGARAPLSQGRNSSARKPAADLTSHLAAADVFVFPSLTDTFGVVQLEALACGTPVAAFPVTGPLDVIADHPIGALDTDLRRACIGALTHVARSLPQFCARALLGKQRRQFIGNLTALQPSRVAATGAPRACQRSAVQG